MLTTYGMSSTTTTTTTTSTTNTADHYNRYIMFEMVSAYGTVGYSIGVATQPAGQLLSSS